VKVVIAAGGTGGHLYPGIAIARELLRQGDEVVFAGTAQGIEARVLPAEKLPVRFITVGKLKGMGLTARFKTLMALPRSVLQAVSLLRQERPGAVVGVGGYASGPVALAAWLHRLPLIIVEPNSYAGLANRVAGRFAKKIFLCFPGRDSQGFFAAGKKVLTGPLVRKGIEQGNGESAKKVFGLAAEKYTVLVMGGSGGAHAINMAMKDAAKELATVPRLQVLHQTGEKDAAEVGQGYREAGLAGVVLPYINDMAGAYAAADLVVCRSGATTVAELAVCGKQAVLIPFPFAADNHQEHNARALADRGGATVIVQKDLTPAGLAQTIKTCAAQARRGAEPLASTAAEEIARACKEHV